jgi:hypothetical protein
MANKKEINAAVDRVVLRVLTIAGLGFVAVQLAGQLIRMSQPDPTAQQIQAVAERLGEVTRNAEPKMSPPTSEPVSVTIEEPTIEEILGTLNEDQLRMVTEMATVNGSNPNPSQAELVNAMPPDAIEAAKEIVNKNKKIAAIDPEVVTKYFIDAMQQERFEDAKMACRNKTSRSILRSACDVFKDQGANQ